MLPGLDFLQSLGDGIHVIDTGFHRPRFDAAYLLVQGGRAAFVDTGTNVAMSDAQALALRDMDIELNAQGMGIRLDKRAATTR